MRQDNSQATRNSTLKCLEKLEFFYIKFQKIYISILGDDINNISLFFHS